MGHHWSSSCSISKSCVGVVIRPEQRSDFLAGSVLLLLFAEAPRFSQFSTLHSLKPKQISGAKQTASQPASLGLSFSLLICSMICWVHSHSGYNCLSKTVAAFVTAWVYRDRTLEELVWRCRFLFFLKTYLLEVPPLGLCTNRRAHFQFTLFKLINVTIWPLFTLCCSFALLLQVQLL